MRRAAGAILLLAILALSGGCARKARDPNPERADLLRSPEEWLKQEPIRLLRDYVRIDTTEAKGEENGALFLREILACDGIETEIVCPAPKRCNLLARLPGRSRDGALLLLSHIDVAGARPERWTEGPPFEGVIKQGFLYGRGTYDMKSVAIAQALAMRALKRNGIVPQSDVLLLAEADEEVGQRWGARWLLDHRPEWFRGVGYVLNEGGINEMILREVRFWALETLQAGYGTLELEAEGAAPLETLANRWKSLPGRVTRVHRHVALGFELLANHLSSPLTDPLRHLDRVLQSPEELRILPDRYGSFLEPRIFWSPPYGDPEGPAGRIRRYVIVSTPPGTSPVPHLAAIRKDAQALGIDMRHAFGSEPADASPWETAPGRLTPFVDMLKRVTEAHYPGVAFGPVPTSGGYTTSNLFRSRGIPSYGYTPVPMNIFDASRRHDVNERVYLRDYLNGVALYQGILEEFALVPLKPSVSRAPERVTNIDTLQAASASQTSAMKELRKDGLLASPLR
ncbi:MAG: M20/M25/M40 family metallo-hydrolase [Thermoanaerobaculia bacterium]